MSSYYLAGPEDTSLSTTDANLLEQFAAANADRKSIVETTETDADFIVLFDRYAIRGNRYPLFLDRDPFFLRNWNKIYCINWDDIGRGYLPGLYVSLNPRNFDAAIHRACPYPDTYNKFSLKGRHSTAAEAKYLYSFQGAIHSHPIRTTLAESLADGRAGYVRIVDQQFHSHSQEQKREFVETVLNSKFVLCPRGFSPSTYRLYEVMALGRCPVIISDDWIKPDGVDWESFSLRVNEDRIEEIPALLESLEPRAEEFGQMAMAAFDNHFSNEAKHRGYLDAIFDLHHQRGKKPADYRRRWESAGFRRANGFDIGSRIRRKLTVWKR